MNLGLLAVKRVVSLFDHKLAPHLVANSLQVFNHLRNGQGISKSTRRLDRVQRRGVGLQGVQEVYGIFV